MADVIGTIGANGTHADIAAWITATNTPTNGNRYIGELLDEVYEVDAGALILNGTGINATTYRWLRPASAAIHKITSHATTPGTGTWTLTVNGETTAPIAAAATTTDVNNALNALSGVAPGDVVVTGSLNLGVAATTFTLTWSGPAFANKRVIVSASFAGMSGNPHTFATWSLGGYYKPEKHQGPRIYVRWTGTSDQAGIKVVENFFRLSGIGIICEDPQEVTGGNKYGVWVQGDDFLASRVFCKIEEGGTRQSISAPIFYCYYVNGVNPATADRATFLNCIAYGSKFYKGAHYGFYLDNFAANGGCFNCAAYSIRHQVGGSVGGFFNLTGSTVRPKLVNCTAVDCTVDIGGAWSSIALDPTNGSDPLSVGAPYSCVVTANPATGSSASYNQQADGRSVHQRPEVQDLRPPTGSIVFGWTDTSVQPNAVRKGRDMSTIWSGFGLTPEDFDGTARPAGPGGYLSIGWVVGPYHTAGTPLSTTPPTIETWTVGATGRNFATIQAALDATDDQSLVYQNKVVRLVLYPDADFAITAGQRVVFRRAICDARHYREITVAPGFGFDPIANVGVKITGTGGTVVGEDNLVEMFEAYSRLTGPILVDCTYSGASNRKPLKVQGDNIRVDAVFARLAASTGTSSHCVIVRGSRVLVTNSVAIGSNGTNTGANSGFNVQNCEFSRVYCCVAWGIKGNAAGNGFREGANTNRVEFSSCIATDCTTCFSSGNSAKTESNCISGDTSADGVGAQVSKPTASLFTNAAALDFRNVSGSPAIKTGRNLAARFSTDFSGAQRYAPFDCGIHEGLPAGPLFLAPDFKESRAYQTCWELARRDGVVLLFTDQNEPVTYRGRTYDPGGSFQASNRRADVGSDNSVGVRAAFTSAKITAADLAAGRYRGARLREILLGRYPWTKPISEEVYVLGEIEWDADNWSVDFASLSSLLDRNAGRLITVGCGLEFGGPECLVDLGPNTLDDVRVTSTIQDPLRKFNANTTDVSGSYADDFFGRGRLTWLTGQNAGLVSQVKSYTASARTIELEEAVPYAITSSDTFQLEPGCRLRYLADCLNKNSNGANYGGEPFAPGTDKSLSTPTR